MFTLRTVDTFRIREFVEKNHPQSVVLAGGGFHQSGAGRESAGIGHGRHSRAAADAGDESSGQRYGGVCPRRDAKNGIRLMLGHSVEGFEEKKKRSGFCWKEKEALTADMVALAIGVSGEHSCKEAGLKLGVKGSIVVNDRMETSAPDIYAVGDAVQVKHFVTGEDTLISLAGPANKQGRIAADNICGKDSRYKGLSGVFGAENF